jgi:6-phosphogluconolactonase
MVKTKPKVIVLRSRKELSAAVSGRVAQLARQADVERGAFPIALSGGALLESLCPGLVSIPLRDEIYWASWHVFWADERCVPPSSPDSNFAAAERRLFRYVGIPRSQIHAMNAAFGPDDGARDYESLMAKAFAPVAGRLPRFDLILLGIGEDGHTASLFPRHALLSKTRRWVAPVFDAPKPPPERMTLTLPVINNARHVVFVAAGESKAPALAAVINPDRNDALLPAGQVDPTEGVVQWFVDDDAARGLPRAGVSTEARS